VLPKPFLDATAVVDAGGERGLLGLAFHPKYAQNGRFFVYYTNTGGDVTIAEGKVDAQDANKASTEPLKVLLTIEHSEFGNHNGGWLDFGPDGKLYAGVGDGGAGDDPYKAGQNKKVLLAKILRLDVDIAAPYIPADNPFAGAGGGVRGEIWAFGVRNPWRNSFDRQTGDLYIADVGQNAWEELDVQPAGSTGGTNYGWSDMEGKHCYLLENCTTSSYTLPVLEYEHPKDQGAGSITGGYVYRGCKMPDLAGTYFFADYSLDRFQSLKWNGASGVTDLKSYPQFAGKVVTTFGQDRNGEILFVDYNQGRLYRMIPKP
jgi:glucose/arabinose dehydrogenase